MCCSKLNYINNDVIIVDDEDIWHSDGKDGDVADDDEGNGYVFHEDCNDNVGYDIFLIYF